MKKISEKRYLQGFGLVVIALATLRAVCPSVAGGGLAADGLAADSLRTDSVAADSTALVETVAETPEQAAPLQPADESAQLAAEADAPRPLTHPSRFFHADGTLVKNPIYSVPHFGNTFPDQNDVQLLAAEKYGVKPVADRADAERRKDELVYVGSNPFFHVDRLKNSIPYLVPRAAVLLQDIGSNFFDSLQVKGIPLHKIIVTSVLRSRADVAQLQSRNSNATTNSCHLYATTFDVCYNRYKTVSDPDGRERRKVQNDTLKWVLSEVLRDLREQQRCLIKYEVKQGCFHITVK